MAQVESVKVRDIEIGSKKLTILAGPCVLDTYEDSLEIATHMKALCEKYGFNYIFKGSFDKANRTSITSFRGPGMETGLSWLKKIGETLDIPVVTDIHEPYQAEIVAKSVDLLQIPAFLCRQTDLLVAASKTGKPVNVKKAQFMAPEDMRSVVNKLHEGGNSQVMLCDRGTEFGYHELIVDFRSLPTMRSLGCPVVFDATHSVQKPGAGGTCSGGDRQYILPLIRAAISVGVDAIFMEVHKNPVEAKCDGPNSIKLSDTEMVLAQISALDKIVRNDIGYADLNWASK